MPAVLPVNFSLDEDGAVVLRTSAASELVRAFDGAVVAFETDAAAHSGGSVVLTGMATVVTGLTERERLTRRRPRSWAPSPADVFVRVEPELVSGRELVEGRSMYGVDLTP